jgi:NAD(P)-dependent dehydrogenase (short-subunit alcohol dehydrogenase family)
MSNRSPHPQDIAIVTGASTGMGAATAREMARRGFHVLAGVRRDSDGGALGAAGIEPVILDVTNREHIAALVARWGEASPPGPNARPHVMLRVCSDVSSERGRTGRPGSTGTWLPA